MVSFFRPHPPLSQEGLKASFYQYIVFIETFDPPSKPFTSIWYFCPRFPLVQNIPPPRTSFLAPPDTSTHLPGHYFFSACLLFLFSLCLSVFLYIFLYCAPLSDLSLAIRILLLTDGTNFGRHLTSWALSSYYLSFLLFHITSTMKNSFFTFLC